MFEAYEKKGSAYKEGQKVWRKAWHRVLRMHVKDGLDPVRQEMNARRSQAQRVADRLEALGEHEKRAVEMFEYAKQKAGSKEGQEASRRSWNNTLDEIEMLQSVQFGDLTPYKERYGNLDLFDSLLSGVGQPQQQPAAAQEEDEDAPTSSEGGKMVRLDAGSDGSVDGSGDAPFGPLAILLVGLSLAEAVRLRAMLCEVGGDDVRVLAAAVAAAPTSAAAAAAAAAAAEAGASGLPPDLTLGAALEGRGRGRGVVEVDAAVAAAAAGGLPPPALGGGGGGGGSEEESAGPRVAFLSGMYASEVMEILALFRESGLAPVVYAAAVPNNWGRPLGELVADVCADHAAMAARRRQARRPTV
eukprot:scaffold8.g1662.t1